MTLRYLRCRSHDAIPSSEFQISLPTNFTPRVRFASTLPDGNYRLRVIVAGITNNLGNPLPADRTVDFYVMDGDADRTRTVDFGDLVILARNFNQSPRTFAQGDFDYSGTVDFGDLVILARSFNQTLAQIPATITTSTGTGGATINLADSGSETGDSRGKVRRQLLA